VRASYMVTDAVRISAATRAVGLMGLRACAANYPVSDHNVSCLPFINNREEFKSKSFEEPPQVGHMALSRPGWLAR